MQTNLSLKVAPQLRGQRVNRYVRGSGGRNAPGGGLGGKTPQKNQGFNEPYQENKELSFAFRRNSKIG